ncbi:MAG TPA: xanthine dehydrogenase family protein molybdopterin-binding subunit [Steroidobacteraceae bacterium]
MTAEAAEALRGPATARIDGREKVTGEACYGSDFAPGALAWAYLKTSAIARGRIIDIDERAARAVPGVLAILTYRDVGERVDPGQMMMRGGYMGSTIAPLASAQIRHAGQIVAVVVAESFEGAREAARALSVRYEELRPSPGFDDPGVTVGSHGKQDPKVGDFAAAFAAARITVDAWYETPTQHHNPIELFSTVAAWDGDKLTVWESSQNVWGYKNGLAAQLRMAADDIRVVSPFIGGAFGSRGSLTQRTALIAWAARQVGRPVKLVATRAQGFSIATYRAETRHHVQLGAGADGKLMALRHEGWEVSSRPDDYSVSGTDASTRLYACPNVDSKVSIVHADRNTPGFMRSPPETPYLFALECAMDELAYAANVDPIQLRLRNDTLVEPIKGLPYTSRHLRECFEAAANAFGWATRTSEPRSMRDGEWMVGWGAAATMYPTQVAAAAARVRLTPAGSVRVQSATHEIGTGVRTAMAITAAEALGVPIARIEVETGDTRLPPAPVSGGSNSTASVCNAIASACEQIRDRLARAAVADAASALAGSDPATLQLRDGTLTRPDGQREPLQQAAGRLGQGAIEVYVENTPPGVTPQAASKLYAGRSSLAGGANLEDRIQFAFGAHLVEVRVHARTREIRAPRAVGAFAFGRIVNPTAARSQLMGGQIWGISAALHEATEIDRQRARYYNDDLAEYLIPVNADIIKVETIMLPELDTRVNRLGIKGVGELGNVGMNAAVANAVYHATGIRVRKLPIRLEKLLDERNTSA